MLFYYLCTIGEEKHREAYPQGAQSKDSDVFKWVTMHSGSPAVCQREHPALHRWRPDEGGEEERIVRSYAVLQWDKQGYDPGIRKPLVVERVDDELTGTFFLLRIFPHGFRGKKPELGLQRHDVPEVLAGKV
jgi:hypothetical protein